MGSASWHDPVVVVVVVIEVEMMAVAPLMQSTLIEVGGGLN